MVKKSPKGIKRKEAIFRLIVIFSPLIVPQFINFGENLCVYIPIIWMIFFAPIYFCPNLSLEFWDEKAKPFHYIFIHIGKIYSLGMMICFAINAYIGKLDF